MRLVVEAKRVCAFLLIVFSGLCLNVLPINPIYITMIAGSMLLIMLLLRRKVYFILNKPVCMTVLILVYLFSIEIGRKTDNTFYNVVFSLLYFVCTYIIACNLKPEILIRYSKKFIDFSVVLLVVEAITRLINSFYSSPYLNKNSFYRYKENSIMYEDSNFVGALILIVVFFLVYLENCHDITFKWQKKVLFALCIFTFSRAAILVLVAGYFVFDKRIKKNFKVGLIFLIGFAILYVFLNYLMDDGSFLSKFEIIGRAYRYFVNESSWYVKLFGVGLGQSKNYIGISAHNIFVMYILETGIVGTVLFFVYWLFIFGETHGMVYYVMIPFLVLGLSMAPMFIPYLYTIFSIIMVLEKKNLQL